MNWIYEGKELTEELINDYIGFVYLITNLTNGRMYIGKKILKFARRRKIKGRSRRILVDSDFKGYYGSNLELLADVAALGSDAFSRTVLRLCKTKSEMTYWEGYEQFSRHVLLDPIYYNTWIMCKVRRSGVLGEKHE